ncbi:MAG: sugar phosphate isomerase/epimerase [Dictyoglomus sp.]|nr:sugar phosphate isomerase/epimerase [Dictyoglomus sp.]MCX7845680.1 sugar phosphate isomerase/epimerase [Dictyoglomaceae bacterium]MDW8188484.1 sugar phosphate isomerase/epimerase [Dictyoglomus sp.]
MRRIPIALQLYSVRKECEKDFEKTIKEISEMGYEGVEFAGYYGKSANELKKILNKYNLKVAGTHIPINTLIGDELEKTVEFNYILENKYLIIPSLPEEYTKDKKGWEKAIELINEISSKLRSYKMILGFHNHSIEFQRLNGETFWNFFFDNVNEDVVMQLDTGNAMNGGADPIEILRRYLKRAKTIHLKEYPLTSRAIGEGIINWKEIFDICEKEGKTEWYIVEYENPSFPPLESVRLCLENIKKIKE